MAVKKSKYRSRAIEAFKTGRRASNIAANANVITKACVSIASESTCVNLHRRAWYLAEVRGRRNERYL
jgi:hypothetical protein